MAETGVKNKDLILETIDQCVKGKVRPDLSRVTQKIERDFAISRIQTAKDLEKLVDESVVIKVVYKGRTSYYNASTWGRRYYKRLETPPTDVTTPTEAQFIMDVGLNSTKMESTLNTHHGAERGQNFVGNTNSVAIEGSVTNSVIKIGNPKYNANPHQMDTDEIQPNGMPERGQHVGYMNLTARNSALNIENCIQLTYNNATMRPS